MIEAERMANGNYRGVWAQYLTSGLWYGVNLPLNAAQDGARRGFIPPALSETERRWRQSRRRLLAAWIEERPGSRPWAWWLLDAPELRAPMDGRTHPFEREDGREFLHGYRGPRKYQWLTRYGLPAVPVSRADVDIEYESELVYLLRLGLLTRSETAALIERGELVPAGGSR